MLKFTLLFYFHMQDLSNSLYSFDQTEFEANTTHQQIGDGGLFICLKGEADFFLNLNHYRLKAGDLCVAFPNSILQTVNKSSDFEGFGIGANTQLFSEIQLPSPIDYYIFIRENPCISLMANEQGNLLEACHRLIEKNSSIGHPFRHEITQSLFKIVYFEIAAIYKKGTPIKQEAVSRKEFLVRNFLYLMASNFLKHKDVDFYAQQLCVSPRYLSAVIKEKTGNGALFWINDTVINRAKGLLQNSRLSVMQISDELNFANPSFFGQYFKKHTGMTPKKYRDRG